MITSILVLFVELSLLFQRPQIKMKEKNWGNLRGKKYIRKEKRWNGKISCLGYVIDKKFWITKNIDHANYFLTLAKKCNSKISCSRDVIDGKVF